MQDNVKKFIEIVRKYHGPVYRHVMRNLDDLTKAEDVTQEIFLSVFRDLRKFRAQAHVRTWIYRITANKCLAEQRRNTIDSISLEEAGDDEQLIDEESNPEQRYLKREADIRLDRLIARLPGKEAVVITLCYYDDRSCEDIARILRIPPGTVAVILHRGRLHLHKLLLNQKTEEKR